MASEFGRGFKFGVGFAFGVSVIMLFFLFGVSMCAGHLHRRMFEQMQEMLPKEPTPPQDTEKDLRHSFNAFSFPAAAIPDSTFHWDG